MTNDADKQHFHTAARILVLGFAVVFYIAAGLAYWNWPEYLWITGILGTIATIYFLIYVAGSENACIKAVTYLVRIM